MASATLRATASLSWRAGTSNARLSFSESPSLAASKMPLMSLLVVAAEPCVLAQRSLLVDLTPSNVLLADSLSAS